MPIINKGLLAMRKANALKRKGFPHSAAVRLAGRLGPTTKKASVLLCYEGPQALEKAKAIAGYLKAQIVRGHVINPSVMNSAGIAGRLHSISVHDCVPHPLKF